MTKIRFRSTATLACLLAGTAIGCGGDPDGEGDNGAGGSGGTTTGLGGSAAGPSTVEDTGCPEALGPLPPTGSLVTVGDGSTASCSEAELKSAIAEATSTAEGGTVTFDCGADEHTITLTSAIEVDGKLMLDGENHIVISGGGVDRILDLAHHSELVVQRIVLRDGRTEESGGAIHHPWYGTLHVIDVTFENNHATIDTPEIGGGAIFAGGLREVVISDSRFLANSGSNGGAVLNRGSTLTVVNTIFRDNEATSYNEGGGQYGNGGGLYIDGMAYEDVGPAGDLHLCGSIFFNNGAKQHGSAVFGYFYAGSTAYIDRCHFDGNTFTGSPAGSGGLYHGAVPLWLTNSTFSGNTALQGHGAAIQMESSAGTEVHATNCTFHGNEAEGNAGAIFASNSPLVATNCTFAENRADYAPAIFKGQSGSVTLTNSIFANNGTDNEFSAVACHETFADGGGNIQWPATKNNGNDDTPCTEGILFADPLLGALGDHEGPTPTLPLGADSPAIGLGTDCPTTDQTGAARAATCDAGAWEFQE